MLLAAQPSAGLEVTMAGNAGVVLSDGATSLLVDCRTSPVDPRGTDRICGHVEVLEPAASFTVAAE